MKLDIKAEVHLHVHLPANHRESLEEILEAIAILHRDMTKMTETSERLTREVAETREAVTNLQTHYQTKIDTLTAQTVTMQDEIDNLKEALANGDTEAATAAADALDALQTEIATTVGEPLPGGGNDTISGEGEDTTGGGSGEDTLTEGAERA